MQKGGYVYIMTNKRNGTLYTGVTNDLIRRVCEHKEGKISGFTKDNDIKTLVYYECWGDIRDAIKKEKIIKHWKREWRIKTIEESNSRWEDLYPKIIGS